MAAARQPGDAAARSKEMCESLRQQGNTLFAKGKFSAAIERYTEAITLCPDVAVLYANRALCHKKLNDVARQKEDAEKALALDREHMKAHYLLGGAFYETGHFELASAHLQKALDLARAKDDSIKDEIFRALARAKHSLWEQQAAARAQTRKELQASLDGVLGPYVASGKDTPQQQAHHEPGSKAALAQARILHTGVQALLDAAALQDKPKEVPSAFTCPLTLEPFRDPVITPAGQSYERSALLLHLSRSEFDPIARTVRVRQQDLIPNLNLRNAVQAYLDQNPYAWGDCR